MRLALKDLKTKQLKYFAGYDISKSLLIHWTPFLIEAVPLSKEILTTILDYLCIRLDTKHYRLIILD